ncbi:WxL domain-containing protein, partial [Enterobacter roggenkampii]|uniref:WxL domain-containing protein n=1 Tax=Enterobacter roggenkampii TaxID=1812935 RepID=UPI0021CF01B7
MSEFRSNSRNNVLTGAEITFKEPSIKYEGSNQENTPVAHSSNITLSPDTGSQLVMNAADGKGAGVSSVIWGDQEQLNADYENPQITTVLNPFIELSVPGSTVKDATTYQATLTWS